MTTIYPDKEIALSMGIYYAGRSKDLTIDDLKEVKDQQVADAVGNPLKSDIYELTSSSGETVRLGIEYLDDGKCCLWLIAPTGHAIRT